MFWMLLKLIGTLCQADLSSNDIVWLLKGADPKDHRIELVSHRNEIESAHEVNPGIAQPEEEEKTSQLPVGLRSFASAPRHPPYKPIGEPVLYKGCRLHMKKFSFFIHDSMHAAASFWYITCVVCGGGMGWVSWAWSRAIACMEFRAVAKRTLQDKLMNRLTTSPRRSDERMFRHSSLRSLVRSFAASVVSCNVFARYVVIRWWVALRQEHVVNWGAKGAPRCRIERTQSDDPPVIRLRCPRRWGRNRKGVIRIPKCMLIFRIGILPLYSLLDNPPNRPSSLIPLVCTGLPLRCVPIR